MIKNKIKFKIIKTLFQKIKLNYFKTKLKVCRKNTLTNKKSIKKQLMCILNSLTNHK